jgi:hypothetical protein
LVDSRTLPARHGPGRDHHLTSTSSGTTSVADQVLDGVRQDRFYIFPAQPEIVAQVHARMTGIIDQRNPDPQP